MKRWFISDLHLNHANIIKYCNRPFSCVDEMNAEIIARWNKLINSKDTVYVVGDVFLGRADKAQHLVQSLNGNKILIKGNHDKNKDTMIWSGFSQVHNQLTVNFLDGRRVLLNHKPLENFDSSRWDLLIHGHTHEGPRVNGKFVNVCVDIWDFYPIEEKDIPQASDSILDASLR